MTFNEREMFDIVCFCFESICPGIKVTLQHLTISVLFLAIESFIFTQIHLLKSEVPVGSNAEFNCTTSNPLHNKLSRNMILVYLIKNGNPIKVNIWDTEKMMKTFTLREVQMEDAGTYSCVVLLNILPYHGMRLYQNIKVDLQIIAGKHAD